MISLPTFTDTPRPLASDLFAGAAQHAKAIAYESVAKYCGEQENLPGLPPLHLWNLKVQLGPHPINSTVTEQTLDKWLFPVSGKYGSTTLPEGKTADFAAVETPPTAKQIAADAMAEARSEGRTMPESRVNPHD